METLKSEVIAKQIEDAQKDIIKNEILIGYLDVLKKDLHMTKQEVANTDLKIEALKRDIKFNKGYIAYASKL